MPITMAMPPGNHAYHVGRKNVRLGFINFCGFNFRGLPVNRENHENWIP